MEDLIQFLPEGLRQVAEGDDDTVVQSPEDVMHLRAVPQTDDKKDENIGNAGGKNAACVFSEMFRAPFAEALHRLQKGERVENVVAHERAEADVSAAPEITERDAEIWLAEVWRKFNAEDLRDAGDDIDPAGKIRVLLGRIEQDSEYDDAARKRIHRPVEECRDVVGEHVRDGVLFHEAEENEKQRPGRFLTAESVLFLKLRRHRVKTSDRPLDYLWEPGYIKKVFRKVLLRRLFSIAHIHEIADRHEGIKGNPKRQQESFGGGENLIPVLEASKNKKIEEKDGDENDSFFLLNGSLQSLSCGAIEGRTLLLCSKGCLKGVEDPCAEIGGYGVNKQVNNPAPAQDIII